MKKFRNLFILITILIFTNIFFGPLVRATDSGLACPDWPLCHGKFIPEYTFQIAMEVGHRFYSGSIGLLIFAGLIASFLHPPLRPFRFLLLLINFFLITQVTLGALTVTRLLDPTTVNLHLLNATILLALSITLAMRSHWHWKNWQYKPFRLSSLFSKTTRFYTFLVLVIGFQLFLGGRVSSHYSGLACPDFPTCYGEWFPEMVGTIRYQMEHRWFGYTVAIALFWGLYRIQIQNKEENLLVQKLIYSSVVLILVQIGLGAWNVLSHLPKLVTATHTTVGVLLFLIVYSGLVLKIHQVDGIKGKS